MLDLDDNPKNIPIEKLPWKTAALRQVMSLRIPRRSEEFMSEPFHKVQKAALEMNDAKNLKCLASYIIAKYEDEIDLGCIEEFTGKNKSNLINDLMKMLALTWEHDKKKK